MSCHAAIVAWIWKIEVLKINLILRQAHFNKDASLVFSQYRVRIPTMSPGYTDIISPGIPR
jgi:hypothetical protein